MSFDTEQSTYEAFIVGKRIEKMLTHQKDEKGFFALREYEPLERCNIISHALEKFKDNIGYVLIDGIADLAKCNNDEEEATRVVSLLMKWTKIYNCHITVVIHQNKGDNFATGHLGSSIMKKSEVIISVEKQKENPNLYWTNIKDIGWIAVEDMQFYSSYDWIMPVLEKIEAMGYKWSIGTSDKHPYNFCKIGNKNALGLSSIDAIYWAVVGFIKFENGKL